MQSPEIREDFHPVFEIVTELSPTQIEDVCGLYAQLSLSGKTTTPENILRIFRFPDTKMLVVKNGERIIGMTLLYQNPGARRLYVELDDVILDAQYRGRGLGEEMIRRAIEEAKKLGAEKISLSSVEERTEAHALYEKVGFAQFQTRNYEMTIVQSPEGEE